MINNANWNPTDNEEFKYCITHILGLCRNANIGFILEVLALNVFTTIHVVVLFSFPFKLLRFLYATSCNIAS